MEFKAISRKTCEKFCNQSHEKTSIIISIKSPWDKEDPKVFCSDKNNVKDILSLAFGDIEAEDIGHVPLRETCITIADAKKIARFADKWHDKVDMIIVHCDGGVSRSAGVCAAIMQVFEGSGWKMWKNRNKSPNMTCFLRVLKAFNYV